MPVQSGPKAPLQVPYGVRQPVPNDKNNNFECLRDLYQASLQPYQYISFSGAVNGANKVFTYPSFINLITPFVDGAFIHPTGYTVTRTGNQAIGTTTITFTTAPTTAVSIIGM